MFDNLRDHQDTGPANIEKAAVGDAGTPANHPKAGFLGMTSGQRLAVALLVLIAVCLLGTACLLVTGAVRTF
jgi:hypothetical protein